MKKVCFIVLGFFFATPSAAGAESNLAAAIDQANAAYDQGQYEQAAGLYEDAVKDGLRNGHLLYNLGNAYFKAGKVGEAMAAYLGARHYLPRDADVRANLNMVKEKITDKLDASAPASPWQILFFWNESLTIREQVYGTALLTGLGGVFGMMLMFLGAAWLRSLILGSWLLAAVLALGLVVRLSQPYSWAAVVTPTASVYSGPSQLTSSVVFELHLGAPVAVIGAEGDWYKVQISDGKKGWLAAEHLKKYL